MFNLLGKSKTSKQRLCYSWNEMSLLIGVVGAGNEMGFKRIIL